MKSNESMCAWVIFLMTCKWVEHQFNYNQIRTKLITKAKLTECCFSCNFWYSFELILFIDGLVGMLLISSRMSFTSMVSVAMIPKSPNTFTNWTQRTVYEHFSSACIQKHVKEAESGDFCFICVHCNLILSFSSFVLRLHRHCIHPLSCHRHGSKEHCCDSGRMFEQWHWRERRLALAPQERDGVFHSNHQNNVRIEQNERRYYGTTDLGIHSNQIQASEWPRQCST